MLALPSPIKQMSAQIKLPSVLLWNTDAQIKLLSVLLWNTDDNDPMVIHRIDREQTY